MSNLKLCCKDLKEALKLDQTPFIYQSGTKLIYLKMGRKKVSSQEAEEIKNRLAKAMGCNSQEKKPKEPTDLNLLRPIQYCPFCGKESKSDLFKKIPGLN